MQDDYEIALKNDVDLNTKIVKLGEFNELAYEDLTMFINTNASMGN